MNFALRVQLEDTDFEHTVTIPVGRFLLRVWNQAHVTWPAAMLLLPRLSIFGGKSGVFPKISLSGLHYIAVWEVQEGETFGGG